MVDLRSKTHGPGATQGVNLVVMAYDDRIAADDEGAVIAHFLDARVHPGDRRAPGETNLALVSKKDSASESGYDNSARYSAEQLASIEQAAGDNACELSDARGQVVGRAFGIRADLLINRGEVVVNTKTLTATELSVGVDPDGNDIRAQISASMKAARRAREAARARSAEAQELEIGGKATNTDIHRIYQGSSTIL